MAELIPELTPHAIDSLRRWDEGPLVTGDEARYLVGVLRAALLAFCERPPKGWASGKEVDRVAAAQWYDNMRAALAIADAIRDDAAPLTTTGGL